MATEDREILRILAKHVNWQDEGDRAVVAEYFGRDADDRDAFRPFDQEDRDRDDARNRDNRADSDNGADIDNDDDNETQADKDGNAAKQTAVKSQPVPATPATAAAKRR